MSGAVFTHANGVVREDIGDGELRQRGEADRTAHVIGEDKKGGSAGFKNTVVSDAVADCAHAVFANAEPDVTPPKVIGTEVTAIFDVVLSRAVEVGRATNED